MTSSVTGLLAVACVLGGLGTLFGIALMLTGRLPAHVIPIGVRRGRLSAEAALLAVASVILAASGASVLV